MFINDSNLPDPHSQCLSRLTPEPAIEEKNYEDKIQAEYWIRFDCFTIIEQQGKNGSEKQDCNNKQAVVKHSCQSLE